MSEDLGSVDIVSTLTVNTSTWQQDPFQGRYNLKSIIFHSPSEHKFVDQAYDLEMQILCERVDSVSTENSTKYIIFAVIYEVGATANEFITALNVDTLSVRFLI